MTPRINPDTNCSWNFSKGAPIPGAHGTSLLCLAAQTYHHILQDVSLPSTQDPAHPASSLLSDDGQVSGWHTPRSEHPPTLFIEEAYPALQASELTLQGHVQVLPMASGAHAAP